MKNAFDAPRPLCIHDLEKALEENRSNREFITELVTDNVTLWAIISLLQWDDVAERWTIDKEAADAHDLHGRILPVLSQVTTPSEDASTSSPDPSP